MAHHDKILEHRTYCSHCNRYWNPQLLQDILEEQGKESLIMKCFCENRNVVKENINGWVVIYKYKTRVRKPKLI